MKISLPTLLSIIFLVLKLCNVIAWSWWWVFSPAIIWFVINFVLACFLQKERKEEAEKWKKLRQKWDIFHES